jgi:AP-3 complex subunit delta-1
VFWIVGEYSNFIKNGNDLIKTLIDGSNDSKLLKLDQETTIILVPSLIKIYSNFINRELNWDAYKKIEIVELTNIILRFLGKLSSSKYFEIQERSTEFTEFLKLILESIDEHDDAAIEPPLLLTNALPSLFNSWELNPISIGSQKKIPIPVDLDLDTVINDDTFDGLEDSEDEEVDIIEEFDEKLYEDHGDSSDDETYGKNDADKFEIESRKKERQEKLKGDIFYLSNDSNSQIVPPRAKSSDGSRASFTPRSLTPTIQIDENIEAGTTKKHSKQSNPPKKKKEKVLVLTDEVLGNGDISETTQEPQVSRSSSHVHKKKILTIDSSKLDNFDMDKPLDQGIDGSYEITKLRNQLQETSLKQQTDIPEGEEEDVETVVVVRKKKKKDSGAKKPKKVEYDAEGNVIEKPKKKKKKKAVEE